MAINKALAKFRKANNLSLRQIGGEDKVKILSAFENGRSSNLRHISYYVEAARDLDKLSEICEIILFEL